MRYHLGVRAFFWLSLTRRLLLPQWRRWRSAEGIERRTHTRHTASKPGHASSELFLPPRLLVHFILFLFFILLCTLLMAAFEWCISLDRPRGFCRPFVTVWSQSARIVFLGQFSGTALIRLMSIANQFVLRHGRAGRHRLGRTTL